MAVWKHGIRLLARYKDLRPGLSLAHHPSEPQLAGSVRRKSHRFEDESSEELRHWSVGQRVMKLSLGRWS